MKTISRQIIRCRFTLITILGMTVAAAITHTMFFSISPQILHSFGYSPDDLPGSQFWRLFTCIWLTMGRSAFWGAALLVAVIVGACEIRLGTRRTALTFWGGHLAATILLTVVVLLFQEFLHSLAIMTTASTRDVGASAGYFACLGLMCASLPVRYRRLAIPATAVYLVGALLFTIAANGAPATEHSSGLVHLFAFPLGILAAWLFRPSSTHSFNQSKEKTE